MEHEGSLIEEVPAKKRLTSKANHLTQRRKPVELYRGRIDTCLWDQSSNTPDAELSDQRQTQRADHRFRNDAEISPGVQERRQAYSRLASQGTDSQGRTRAGGS